MPTCIYSIVCLFIAISCILSNLRDDATSRGVASHGCLGVSYLVVTVIAASRPSRSNHVEEASVISQAHRAQAATFSKRKRTRKYKNSKSHFLGIRMNCFSVSSASFRFHFSSPCVKVLFFYPLLPVPLPLLPPPW